MKKLPINRQEFRSLMEENCIYVDKTRHIYRLINDATQYFFSRPRRFGKSLLVNTLKELFHGNKELFKGLWIYDRIDWKQYPVIHLSFSNINHQDKGLANAINDELDLIAQKNSIELIEQFPGSKFREMLQNLGKDNKVVILIDEYDKPIIDYIDEPEMAEKNRVILKNFYSVIKDSEQYIRFLFITGVSKFSKVSIFSDLNHLEDITIHQDYNDLIGITKHELKIHFSDYIERLAEDFKDYYKNILKAVEDEYFGYSWDGKNFLYNPYTLIHLFSKRRFSPHWFMTGTPTFLIKMIKEKQYTSFDFDNIVVSETLLEKYHVTNITLIPLLFQTGYLTIKNIDLRSGLFTLGFPNKEIERAFSIHLIAEFNGGRTDKTDTLLNQLTDKLKQGDIEKFVFLLQVLFKDIVYSHIEDKERYYHSIFYLVVKMIGFYIDSEVLDSTGRIDAVIKTTKQIIVTEFKTTTAEEAMKQLKDKQYHRKYMNDKRQIIILAIGFDTEKRNISDHLIEVVKNVSV